MYEYKYIKYKIKYLNLKNKNQEGGCINYFRSCILGYKKINPKQIDIDIVTIYKKTIGSCVKELIEASFELYNEILKEGKATIICGGQSPAYYCLAMMNFKIYNPNLVNIIILPHSKGGQKSEDQVKENELYCQRLKEKDIILNSKVIIIDGVHSGVGILSLESALKYCFPTITTKKYAINTDDYISKIPVDKTIKLSCEPIFSDIFPRIINSYHPRYFHDSSKFKIEFNLDDNSIGQMIIDLARKYPNTKIEDTQWYKLNNIITQEIALEEQQREEKQKKLKIQGNNRGKIFKPIVIINGDEKKYQCPECKTISGTGAPLNPEDYNLFGHSFLCPYKFSIPKE